MPLDSIDETRMVVRMKAELRKRLRGLRQTTPESACKARSNKIVEALLGHVALLEARSVALFWPLESRHEVDLRPCDVALRARGCLVAYPRVNQDTGVLDFYFLRDPSELLEADWGGLEPDPARCVQVKPGELCVIVVPALAADPRGHRLGYGAGYYDRSLPPHLPKTRTLAVIYDFQLMPELPTSPSDVAVQWVVTDRRTLASSLDPTDLQLHRR